MPACWPVPVLPILVNARDCPITRVHARYPASPLDTRRRSLFMPLVIMRDGYSNAAVRFVCQATRSPVLARSFDENEREWEACDGVGVGPPRLDERGARIGIVRETRRDENYCIVVDEN